MDNLVCIFRTYDVFQANIIKSKLNDLNIYCFLKSNDASGTLPYLNLTQGGIEIYVPERDLIKSQKIISQYNQ